MSDPTARIVKAGDCLVTHDGDFLVVKSPMESRDLEPDHMIPGWGVVWGCDAVNVDGQTVFVNCRDIDDSWTPDPGEKENG